MYNSSDLSSKRTSPKYQRRLNFFIKAGILQADQSSWFNLMTDDIVMVLFIQCEAPKIAKLVQITPITMVYGTYNYSYWGL
jgi:hypothetical protein